MVIFRDIAASRLKSNFTGRIRATIALVARNPSIAALWFVAIYTGALGLMDYRNLKDITEYANRWQIETVYEVLKAGFYCLISIVAAGFALVLASIRETGESLSSQLSVDSIDVDVPIILEEIRLEREARAAEKRFNDGDTTAREYRTAIAEIEKKRWQLRMAAASRS